MDMRSFMWGTMAGVVIFVMAVAGVSSIAGIHFVPTKTEQTR